MDFILILLQKVTPIFIIISIGFLYGRVKKLDTKLISELILIITLPCFAFVSVIKINLAFTDLLITAIAPIVVSLGTAVCVFIFLRVNREKECRGLYLATMFVNAGNIALPITLLAYGNEGVASALIYIVVLGLLIFSLGVFIASRGMGITQLLRQYVLYATILGLSFNIFQIPIPKEIYIPLDLIGSITIPMLLLTLGYNLNALHISSLKYALVGSLFRMGIGFLLSWLFFIKMLGLTSIAAKTIVLLSSMPTALVVYPIAEQYDANPDIVASVIVASTLMSIITIPLVIWFLG